MPTPSPRSRSPRSLLPYAPSASGGVGAILQKENPDQVPGNRGIGQGKNHLLLGCQGPRNTPDRGLCDHVDCAECRRVMPMGFPKDRISRQRGNRLECGSPRHVTQPAPSALALPTNRVARSNRRACGARASTSPISLAFRAGIRSPLKIAFKARRKPRGREVESNRPTPESVKIYLGKSMRVDLSSLATR